MGFLEKIPRKKGFEKSHSKQFVFEDSNPGILNILNQNHRTKPKLQFKKDNFPSVIQKSSVSWTLLIQNQKFTNHFWRCFWCSFPHKKIIHNFLHDSEIAFWCDLVMEIMSLLMIWKITQNSYWFLRDWMLYRRDSHSI